MVQAGSLASLYDSAKVSELENAEELSGKDQKKLDSFLEKKPIYDAILQALGENIEGTIAAFQMVYREGSSYWSDNYKWFCNKYPCFLYVDRIVVGSEYRKYGIGRRLYEEVISYARKTGVPLVTAEIDIAPKYNTASMAFHKSMGFREVGTKPYGRVTVSLQALEIEAGQMERNTLINIRIVDSKHKVDINIPNEPFPLFGRMIPRYEDGKWSYTTEKSEDISEMRFPDENYDYDAMSENSTFIGAYNGEKCIGLAIMQEGFFKYMYLYDLKVNSAYRGKGVAAMLIDKAKKIAAEKGYRGIYTQGQDNNLGACLFYTKYGFRIGGLDTEVYKGTSQEGKADIIFYYDF